MNLLTILLTVMSFTVTSKNSVSCDGTWPYSMDAAYSNTFRKGDVRDGDTALLVVTGLGSMTVEHIDVYLKSNKTEGAGAITVSANGVEKNTMSGTFAEWVGAYDNSAYHPVSVLPQPVSGVGELEILIAGTVNSLHIEKYEITYNTVVEQTNTVTLMKGGEVVDVLSGSTVTLPALADTDEWLFAGWTDEPFYERTEWLPAMIAPGEFLPEEDITLWAVYEHKVQMEQLIATELRDGIYLYVDRASGRAMSGSVWNGKAGTATVNLEDHSQWYEVTFDADGLATIRLMYVYGEEYIGFSDGQLANTPSKWQVYHDGMKTAFYTVNNSKTYILWPDKLQSDGVSFYAELFEVDDVTTTTTSLVHADMSVQLYLTCYPDAGFDVETLTEDGIRNTGEWVIPFGNYELRIRDGKKYLLLK